MLHGHQIAKHQKKPPCYLNESESALLYKNKESFIILLTVNTLSGSLDQSLCRGFGREAGINPEWTPTHRRTNTHTHTHSQGHTQFFNSSIFHCIKVKKINYLSTANVATSYATDRDLEHEIEKT